MQTHTTKLTTDTITDAQIRELHALMVAGEVVEPNGLALIHDAMCHAFRVRHCAPNCQERRKARGRLADILNTLNTEAR